MGLSSDGSAAEGVATLLFTDVEGAVRLWEDDREAMEEASSRHNWIVREQVEAAGGRVFRTVGECVGKRTACSAGREGARTSIECSSACPASDSCRREYSVQLSLTTFAHALKP